MKSSFADADAETPTTPVEEKGTAPAGQSTALAAPASTAVVPDSFFSNDAVTGDFDRSDVKMPRLALGQLVGDLTNELGFKPGDFVYNKEVALGSEGLRITLTKLHKYFVEDLPFDKDGPIPQFFKTLEDARKAGFLDVKEKWAMGDAADGHKFVKPVMDADVLIEGKPTEAYASFPLDFNGTPYALARWTLQSTAYTRVGKQFFSDSLMNLRAGLSTKFYVVAAKKEKLGQNFVFVPSARLAGKNSDEFVKWVKELTS